MNTLEIIDAIGDLDADSIGVYAANHVPKLLSTPAAIITNLDTSDKPGSHWVAIYIDKNGYGIYFDSYGLAPASKYHLDRLRKNCERFQWNKKQVQSVASQVCGEHCIMFLYHMCSGISLRKYLHLFSSDYGKNDALAVKFYQRLKRRMKNKTLRHRNRRVNAFPRTGSTGQGMCNQICTSRVGYISSLSKNFIQTY